MGLAATQARLLFITARQNDVSAKMQKVSNDTLILARDKEEIATNYDKMVNGATVTTTSSNLSYNNVMGIPAGTAGNYGYVTNSANAIVLSKTLANKFGITAASGKQGDFAKIYTSPYVFASKMTGLSVDEISKIRGEVTEETPKQHTLSIDNIMSGYTSKGTVTRLWREQDLTSGSFNDFAKTTNDKVTVNGSTVTVWRYESTTNSKQSDASLVTIGEQKVNFGDLYNSAGNKKGMISLGGVISSVNRNGDPSSIAGGAISNLKSFIQGMQKQIKTALVDKGLDETKIDDVINSSGTTVFENYKKISWNDAYWETIDCAATGKKHDNNEVGYNEGAIGSIMNDAYKTKNIVAMYCGDGGNAWNFAVNAGSLVKDLMDSIMATLTGNKSITSDGTGGTKTDPTKQYEILDKYYPTSDTNTEEPKDPDATNKNLVNYYCDMWNKLNNSGWILDEENSINEKITNGTYSVIDYSKKVTTTQTTEVDKAKMANADSYYESEMAKLNRKEKELDTKLQKLQTEYSALTTDYESVKSILNANIQKSFVYCQNG